MEPSTASSAARRRNAKNGSRKHIPKCTNSYILKVPFPHPSPFPSYKLLTHSIYPKHYQPSHSPPTEAITASLSTLSVDARKRAEKDSAKKEAKAAAAEKRDAEAKAEAMVYIKRVERNKRKFVTAISGLEAHGMDLKKVAKEFGKKCEFFPPHI